MVGLSLRKLIRSTNGRSRKTADKPPKSSQLSEGLEPPDLSIVQVLTGIQVDLERFLEAN